MRPSTDPMVCEVCDRANRYAIDWWPNGVRAHPWCVPKRWLKDRDERELFLYEADGGRP